jgi:hypothetical protein
MDLIAALEELRREKQKLERVIAFLEELNARWLKAPLR